MSKYLIEAPEWVGGIKVGCNTIDGIFEACQLAAMRWETLTLLAAQRVFKITPLAEGWDETREKELMKLLHRLNNRKHSFYALPNKKQEFEVAGLVIRISREL